MKKIIKWMINILIFMVFFVPFYWMMLTSIKTMGETLRFPPTFWVDNPQWQNFVTAVTNIKFGHYLMNTIIVTSTVIILQIILTVPAAYAFAKFKFKGNNVLFGVVLSTMMIPGQLIFLPVFLMFSKLHLINSLIPGV